MGQKVLVTGAAGFIGSTLCEALVARGDSVVGIDCFTDYYSPALKRQNLQCLESERFSLVEADLNSVDLRELLEGVEVVYHQAGQPGVRSSWGAEFGNYVEANIRATQRLLEACTTNSTLRRFVAASSSSVYGNAPSYPTTETALTRPRSPYGVTKLASEHLCTLYGGDHGVPTVSLRYFTVYGPRQRPDMAFTRFINAGLSDEPINVFGTGSQIRDFTFVSDVVGANLAVTDADIQPGAVFNVAGGSRIGLSDAIDVLSEVLGRPIRVIHGPVVAGDVEATGGDTTALNEATGWEPQISLPDGLRLHAEWCFKNRSAASA